MNCSALNLIVRDMCLLLMLRRLRSMIVQYLIIVSYRPFRPVENLLSTYYQIW